MTGAGTNETLIQAIATAADRSIDELTDLFHEAHGADREFLDALAERDILDEGESYKLWSELLGLPFVALDERSIDPAILHRIPLDIAKRYAAVAVGIDEHDSLLTVAMSNPFDILAVDAIQDTIGIAIQLIVAPPTAIRAALRRQERGTTGIEGLIANAQKSGNLTALSDVEHLRRAAGDDAVVQLVDYVVDEALRRRASDIHLEPLEDTLRLRLRLDGDLEVLHRFPRALHAAVVSRVKVLANLDISETRRPQDGRYVPEANRGQLELRVSTLPSVFGEKVVMRLLNKDAVKLDLGKLRFTADNLARFERGFSSPNGLVLLTGPTGSGKTTTLYAALSRLNVESKNLITVEDPVEYDLPGVTQVQVDPKAERTFATTLRSMLRQDPDVIMVGEIRDPETARIAVQAALTGHMVLSTLHTNSALGAVHRMLDMGVEPYLLGPALRCVVAQRLVPRICATCAKLEPPRTDTLVALGVDPASIRGGFMRGAGCRVCRNKGRRGRIAIHEVLSIDTRLGSLISRGAREDELADAARAASFASLVDDGLAKANRGLVMLDDLVAVARAD